MDKASSIKRHITKTARANFSIPSEEWISYLFKKINRFPKKNLHSFLELVKNWFIAAEDNILDELDFDDLLPFIENLITCLFNYSSLKIEDVSNILQIISILISFNTPLTLDIMTPEQLSELLNVFAELLKSQNQKIIKLIIIIFSELIYKNNELLSFIYSIGLEEKLLSDYLLSQEEDVSSASIFLLCEIAFLDREKSNTILQSLFNFSVNYLSVDDFSINYFASVNYRKKPVYTLFKSILFFLSGESDFLGIIIANDFCVLCNQTISILSELINNTDTLIESGVVDSVQIKENIKIFNTDLINISTLIFSILLLVVNDENGLGSFISTELINSISEIEFIYPLQNQDLFSSLMDLFTCLISFSNSDINQQIISSNIIKQICACIATSEFTNKKNAIVSICSVLASSNKEMCQIVEENYGIQTLFDNSDSFDDDEYLLVIKSLISFLAVCPESKELFSTLDLDKFADEIEHKNDEIAELGYSLLSEVQ